MVKQASESNDTNNVIKTNRQNNKSLFGGVTTLVILFLILSFGSTIAYFSLQQRLTKIQQSTQSLINNQQTSIANQKSLDDFQNQIGDLRKNLQAQGMSLNNTQNQFQQLLGNSRADVIHYTLDEALYLTQQAVLSLSYNHDVPGSITLLTAADQRLQLLNDLSLSKTRQVLAENIAKLEAVDTIDLDGILARLNALQEQVLQLPLFEVPQALSAGSTQPAATTFDSAVASWHKALNNSWNSLQKLVIIRHHDTYATPLLAPQQEIFLKQNLLLLLQQAKWATIYSQNDTYKTSLQQAIDWINRYFSSSAADTQATLTTLMELQKINVSPQLPDITPTIGVIKDSINTMRHDTPAATPTTPAPTSAKKG